MNHAHIISLRKRCLSGRNLILKFSAFSFNEEFLIPKKREEGPKTTFEVGHVNLSSLFSFFRLFIIQVQGMFEYRAVPIGNSACSE